MDAPVPIFKWMQEHKAIGDNRSMNDRGYISRSHSVVAVDQALHQAWQVIWFWRDEVYDFLLIGNRLADIILAQPIVTVFETRIDDAVLKRYQSFFLTEVFLLSKLQ